MKPHFHFSPPYSRLLVLLMLFIYPGVGEGLFAQVTIDSLQTEYRTTPLGLDEEFPRFSWQMLAPKGSYGQAQQAYQLRVSDPAGEVVWDSGRQEDGKSLGITYAGSSLKPLTRYAWQVNVWDQEGKQHEATSWFETGLLDPDPDQSLWQGAEWIGPAGPQLYSHYLSVFRVQYGIRLDKKSDSRKAAFVLGANDLRLMDSDLNIQGVQTGRDAHYIAFELDISGLEGGGSAKMHVYRVGYAAEDRADQPIRTFDILENLVNSSNAYELHTVYLECNFGLFRIYLDGREEANLISTDDDTGSPFADPGFNLNPVGSGNNYISFPMLADIGFRVDAGQKATFSGIEIRNFREPSNILFSESNVANGYNGIFASHIDTGAGIFTGTEGFTVEGGDGGTLFTADPSRHGVPMLRTEFAVEDKPILQARLYSTARGIYEVYLNGERVGDGYFTPGLTQYNKTHQYQTYDVTDMLQSGAPNALGAWLSEGWWGGNITYSGENWNYFGDRPSFRGMLHVRYADGSETWVKSNSRKWQVSTDGPLRYGSFFQGEVYDARREAGITGWAQSGYDAKTWQQTSNVPLQGTTFPGLEYDSLSLISQIGNSPSIVKTLTALDVEEVRPGVYVYDMGQNMVGFPSIPVSGLAAGDTVVLRYAEVRYPDLPEYSGQEGMIMLENIRAALTQDLYIAGGGTETIQPRFTFHGYRYLEIIGLESALPIAEVKGMVVSSIPQLASWYETSNELVNKLWENISWSLRGNFLSIPTDTPARNERMGWSGDINVFSEAATFFADVDPFLDRHLLAMRDIQREDGRFTDVAPVGGGFGGTLWGSAGMVLPWQVYLQYGDTRILQEHYPAMKRYMAFLESKTEPDSGRLIEGPLGDWLSPEGSKNDNSLFWAAYQVHDLDIMARTAHILGKDEEAQAYREKYQARKAFFNATYVDPVSHKTIHSGYEGRLFGPPPPGYQPPKPGDPVDTQASYAIPLDLEVFDDVHKPHAVAHLAAAVSRKNTDDLGVDRPPYSLMTGFIGTASLTPALSDNGRDTLAYRLLQQKSYPSWLYSVVNGATTIWERLNSYTIEDGFGGNNSMNSFNHYSFGAVAAWMYQYSLGIKRYEAQPAFRHFYLEPAPDPTGEMNWARGYYDSMYGRIRSSWQKEGNTVTYNFTVPPNTTATVRLKGSGREQLQIGGELPSGIRSNLQATLENGKLELNLVSGEYEFIIDETE